MHSGGLELGNLRDHNKVLLAKWLWHSPWSLLPFGMGLSYASTILIPLNGCLVKSLTISLLPLIWFIWLWRWNDAYFWEDEWVKARPLYSTFPTLYHLFFTKNHRVANVLNYSGISSSLSFEFCHLLFDREMVEVSLFFL